MTRNERRLKKENIDTTYMRFLGTREIEINTKCIFLNEVLKNQVMDIIDFSDCYKSGFGSWVLQK